MLNATVVDTVPSDTVTLTGLFVTPGVPLIEPVLALMDIPDGRPVAEYWNIAEPAESVAVIAGKV
jgi:hypothetical protein